jgi:hypothetical protein
MEESAGGRMTKRAAHYATRIAKDICKYIAMGKTLEEALEEVGYLAPTMPTVWRWLDEYPEFRDMYERARTLQADVHADQMLKLSREVMTKPTAAAAYRVAIDVLKWQAEVRNRNKYSTKGSEEQKRPMDANKIRAEIARLEKELGVAQSKVAPLKAVAGTK